MNKAAFFIGVFSLLILFMVCSGCIESHVQKTETVITKLDSSGTAVWNRSFDNVHYSSARSATISNTVIETKDGGFLLAGRLSDTSGRDIIRLVKTDRNGEPEWDTAIPVATTDLDYLSVAEGSSGGYWIISRYGHIYLFSSSGEYAGMRELSPQLPGNAERATTVSGYPPVVIYRVAWTPDGGALLLVRNHADIYRPFILAAIAENGTVLRTTTPDQDLIQETDSIIVTGDGGFLWGKSGHVSQLTDPGMTLFRTDRNATPAWNVTFGGSRSCGQCIDVLLGLHESDDGGYDVLYLESRINVTHPDETRRFLRETHADAGGNLTKGDGSYVNVPPDWVWGEATIPQKIISWTSENLAAPVQVHTFTQNREYMMNSLVKTRDGGYVAAGTVYYY